MKRQTAKTIALAVLLLWGAVARGQEAKRVLFVGNSYTSVNNLPQMVAAAALSVGDTVHFTASTPGGASFSQHCEGQSMALIGQGVWDAVVLQEQSQMPSFPQWQVEAEVFPYASQLVEAAYDANTCVEPMFYMTWGRRDGDPANAVFFPVLATYEGMDSMLYLRYMQMGADNDASVCPVGRVWRLLRQVHPEVELYQADGSHPSVAGSYAAACSFCTMLFGTDPMTITYTAGLDPTVAQVVRLAVRDVVYQHLDSWKRPEPAFEATVPDSVHAGDTVRVPVDMTLADSVLWDWGDGSFDLLSGGGVLVANHVYAESGTYNLAANASRHCMTASWTGSITLLEAAGEEPVNGIEAADEPILLWPNPVTDQVNLGVEAEMTLYAPDGREVATAVGKRLDVSALPQGVYLLRLHTDGEVLIRRLLKR